MNDISKIDENTTLPAAAGFDDLLRAADMAAKSDLVPKDFKNKPENCFIAMQMGAEVGLKPLQALQSIAIINGRPSVWGDAMPAMVRNSGLLESIIETFDDSTMTAICKVTRIGEPEYIQTFSMADAKLALLTTKPGPWKQYPKRMLKLRARSFALRDVFPDVLKGLYNAEEQTDLVGELDTDNNASAVVSRLGLDVPPPALPCETVGEMDATDKKQAISRDIAEQLIEAVGECDDNAGLLKVCDVLRIHREAGDISDADKVRVVAAVNARDAVQHGGKVETK